MARMQESGVTRPRPGVRGAKREAIHAAARTVFGRDGYTRTSIDAIATEAGVSTRTIYNHYSGKEQLFSAVLEASAAQVADRFVASVAEVFARGSDDVEALLVGLGTAVAEQRTAFPEHFAMVRQIDAEAEHFPEEAREAWQEAGPRRVNREVSRRLAEVADRGLLRVPDPVRTPLHFIVLVTADETVRTRSAALGEPPVDVGEMVRAGVRAFLEGHAPR
jgi:AcrR family transcriptional regulator